MTKRLIDTHAHLDDERFKDDLDEVLLRFSEAGGGIIINAAASVGSALFSKQLSDKYENVYFTAGVHPHEADSVTSAVMDEIKALAAFPKAVAIGEVGLDFCLMHSEKSRQEKVFADFIGLALETDLPLAVHVRDAHREAIDILQAEAGSYRGVMHCYSGGREHLKSYLDMGFYISLGGVITFKKSDALRDCALYIPEDRILFETDCPYLTPEPLRGRRNEPAFITYAFDKYAALKGLDREKTALLNAANCSALFGIGE